MVPIIDFSVGMSDPDSFPTEALAAAAERAIRDVGSGFAQYPGGYGHAGLREVLAQRETVREDFQFRAEELALTTGSMQGVTLVGQTLLEPGGVIVTEELTYSGTIGAYRGIGADLVGVPVDNHGMVVDELEDVLARLAQEERKPAFIYTIPTYQNPTAAVMPLGRRHQLLDVARRHEILIVEDNCYADVRFEGSVPQTLYALASGENVVYLGSLSKIFAAGVRLGYVIAQQPLLDRIVSRRFDNGSSTLAASICATYLEDNLWEHVERQNQALRKKRDALLEGLKAELSGVCTWLDPVGGLFLWLRLPDGVSQDRLAELGGEHRVGFARGANFHIHSEDVPYIRLAFGHPSPDQVHEGALRLGRTIREATNHPAR